MSNYQHVILDAEWEPTTDVDLIRNHLRLLDDMHHADDATTNELIERVGAARKYIRRSCRRFRGQSRKVTAFTQRLLAGSILFLLWACVMALLLG